jgi:hypothetical protein
MFRKLDLFPSSDEGGEDTYSQLGRLEIYNLSQLVRTVNHIHNFPNERQISGHQPQMVIHKDSIQWSTNLQN